jgi:uncharacterized membrane protein YphA (DoxX/SURF4 family)
VRRVQPWVSTAIRLILGAVWIAAGATKINDLAASGRAVNAYRLLSYDAATFIGAVLPFLEIALGALLILGLATRFAAVVSAVLLIVFIAGIVSAWARGLRIDCGCFGGGGDLAAGEKPRYVSETIRDIALLIAAGLLAAFPRSRFSLDGRLLDGGSP